MGARILLVTGKGGAGTTTVAAATAVHASRAGHKTLLLSADPADPLADLLTAAVGAEPTEVETGLYALQASAGARLGRDRRRQRLAPLLDDLGVDAAAAEHLHLLPAAAEVLALLELRDQARAGTWDLLVVDGGPAAAALRLLALPEQLGGYLDRSVPPGRRVARAMRPGTLGPTGQDVVLDGLRRLEDELADVAALLDGPSTGVRLVLAPQRAALAATRRTLTHLALLGHVPEAVVVNRMAPADPAGGGTDAGTASQADGQRRVLDEVRAAAGGVPVLPVAEQPDEPVGVDALARLGALLHGPTDVGGGLLDPPGTPATVRVEREGGRWLLWLALPHARRADVGLVRRGDDLEVSVATAHRVLRLPSVLRRCRVVEARLRDGRLCVRFEPDPALWPDPGGQP